jgi:hypothetical protein
MMPKRWELTEEGEAALLAELSKLVRNYGIDTVVCRLAIACYLRGEDSWNARKPYDISNPDDAAELKKLKLNHQQDWDAYVHRFAFRILHKATEDIRSAISDMKKKGRTSRLGLEFLDQDVDDVPGDYPPTRLT